MAMGEGVNTHHRHIAIVHAYDYECMLLSFATGEIGTFDVRRHLGDALFERTFATLADFRSLSVNADGGLSWRNGFSVGGEEVFAQLVRAAPSADATTSGRR